MKIKEDFEIKNLTTYKIGGKVKKVFFPETQAEFIELLRNLKEYIVLGGCSNVLFSSNGYSGNVIITTEMKKFEIKGTNVCADCGVKGPLLAQKTADANLSGFEFMIGFPGSIGGDIYMNASAHGQCISDCLISVCVFDKNRKEIVFLTKSELDFSYRKSILQNGEYVILSAEFELKKMPQEEIKALIERNLSFRKDVQPTLATPNAGSVFKNPENDSAGRLLDKAGVKNFKQDNVQVWQKHANFIVNTGSASSEEVLELMVKMKNAVKDLYTIELTPEIIYIGDKTEKEEKLCNILYKTKMLK